jgi:SpoIIAA-like
VSRLVGFLMPCPVRVFRLHEQGTAVAWLQAPSDGPGVSHRLLPDQGVAVIEVAAPLRAQDFDAIASTVDPWIERHGTLRGIVIHARRFPGWESIDGFLRHVRFVRDHQRRVGRIALATDSRMAELVPHLARHFVRAEIHDFGYDDLDLAVRWAAGASAPVGGDASRGAHAR